MGRYDLRLSEREFWRMTPREFAALIERRDDRAQRADWRTAVAVIWLLQPYLEKGKRIEPCDIFPALPAPPESAEGGRARVWYPGTKKER